MRNQGSKCYCSIYQLYNNVELRKKYPVLLIVNVMSAGGLVLPPLSLRVACVVGNRERSNSTRDIFQNGDQSLAMQYQAPGGVLNLDRKFSLTIVCQAE